MTAKKQKIRRPKPELARGFRDISGAYLEHRNNAIAVLSEIYKSYGFQQLETPVLEYAESLGKFLPDVDRPEGGVFGLKDDDEQWFAMRYDLTAPLARFTAKNAQFLPKPYKRFQVGSVFRNEKPGAGRFREFTQFDADSVDTANIAADTELCLMLSEGLCQLGIDYTDVNININNRKLLTAVLELSGLLGDDLLIQKQRGIAMRAIDKLDRLGIDGVELLLGSGRKDESGDYTEGAQLTRDQIAIILNFIQARGVDNTKTLKNLHDIVKKSDIGNDGIDELDKMMSLLNGAGQHPHFFLNPAIVRGLGYYTGPVFEAELTFDVPNDKGKMVQFGSVAGGGRYDELVKRFTGQEVPAVGVSIGLDRLLSALEAKSLISQEKQSSILVCVMDTDHIADYFHIAKTLRMHHMTVDLYVGSGSMKAQMKYADKKNATIAIIQGSDERVKGNVIIKDLQFRARFGDHPPQGVLQQVECELSQMISNVHLFLNR